MASKKESLYEKPRGEAGEAEPKKVTPKEEHPKSHEEKAENKGSGRPPVDGKPKGETEGKEEHGETETVKADPHSAMREKHHKEREDMHKSHEVERRDMHGNHREEHRKMHARHQKAHEDLAKRQESEMMAAPAQGAPAEGGEAAPEPMQPQGA